jgi:hypothetical protein
MNRWRQRLDELQSGSRARSHVPCSECSKCSNPQPEPTFERFEQIEQVAESAAGGGADRERSTGKRAIAPVSLIEAEAATVIAPMQWLVDGAGAADEPPYEEPDSARRGVIRHPMGRFEHFCAVCGAWGAFGYGVTTKEPGVWYCLRHRPVDDGPT